MAYALHSVHVKFQRIFSGFRRPSRYVFEGLGESDVRYSRFEVSQGNFMGFSADFRGVLGNSRGFQVRYTLHRILRGFTVFDHTFWITALCYAC